MSERIPRLRYVWMLGVADIIQVLSPAWARKLRVKYYRLCGVVKKEFRIGCGKCDRIDCVCDILTSHVDGCKFRLSATCPVAVECEHGRDVCPKCDPCTCVKVRAER